MKHRFIAIEGVDGSGKRTQTEKLYEYFKNRGDEVKMISFPNYESKSSEPVKMYLGGEVGTTSDCLNPYEASVLFATDRVIAMKKILSELTRPTTIIFDRYVQSNMIHQSGKIKNRRELKKFLKWLDNLEFNTLGLPRPDHVFWLDVPPAVSLKLSAARDSLKIGNSYTKDIHESDVNHITDAYNGSKFVVKRFGWTMIDCIDENQDIKPIEEIHELVVSKLA